MSKCVSKLTNQQGGKPLSDLRRMVISGSRSPQVHLVTRSQAEVTMGASGHICSGVVTPGSSGHMWSGWVTLGPSDHMRSGMVIPGPSGHMWSGVVI